MKKLHKKLLAIGLTVLFLSISLVLLVKAQQGGLEFYRVDSASTTPEGAKKAESNASIKVINRSGKSYFVPNKTPGEFDSFKNNTPKYVTVSVCKDGICGEYENEANCPEDCNIPHVPYCGDNICNNVVVCATTTKSVEVFYPERCNIGVLGLFVNYVNWVISFFSQEQFNEVCQNASVTEEVPVRVCAVPPESGPKETWESCPDDCSPTVTSTGCGVCGYGANNEPCPNWCNGGQVNNMTNCVYVSGESREAEPYVVYGSEGQKRYFGAAQALAKLDAPIINTSSPSYKMVAGWSCSPSLNPCPAGKTCYPSGLASSPQVDCPAGKFCPAGSWYARVCPPGTYSTGGAAACTSCPPGTYSMSGATNNSRNSAHGCFPVLKSGDGSCQKGENPTNSTDCPDEYSQNSAQWNSGIVNPKYNSTILNYVIQGAYYTDKRCSGVENSNVSSPFYSPDCFCGNGTCDPDESTASCYLDCACGNGICDSVNNPRRPMAALGLDETRLSCPEDCHYGIESDGARVCDTSETVANHPDDCSKCGNGTCDASAPWLETRTSCYADCKCGDGTCNSGSPWYETHSNCSADCFCGDGTCQPAKGEYSFYSGACSADCRCGDGLCDSSEDFSNCFADCHCGSGTCNSTSPYYETSSNCPQDCNGQIKEPYKPTY